MENNLTTQPPHRYPQLDSLRGLAALFVLFTHYYGILLQPRFFWLNAVKVSPLGILFNGNAAVMFFFVLSGFVLSLPYVNGNRPMILTAFYIKRIFRIYPAFIIAIVISLLLKQFLFDGAGMANLPLYVNRWNWEWNQLNIKQLIHTLLLIGPDFRTDLIDPSIWSLVIELKMCVILPFFIVIASRNSLSLNLFFLLVIFYLTNNHTAWAISIFYMGVLLAKYKDELTTHIRSCNRFVLFIVIVFCIFLYNNDFEFSNHIKQLPYPAKFVWSKTLMAIGAGVIMMIILASTRLSQFFNKKPFAFLGAISYSFYLIHAPLLFTTASIFAGRYPYSIVYIIVTTFVLAVIISYLMMICIERPFQAIASYLLKKYPALSKITI